MLTRTPWPNLEAQAVLAAVVAGAVVAQRPAVEAVAAVLVAEQRHLLLLPVVVVLVAGRLPEAALAEGAVVVLVAQRLLRPRRVARPRGSCLSLEITWRISLQ